jgi:hypothetical protein
MKPFLTHFRPACLCLATILFLAPGCKKSGSNPKPKATFDQALFLGAKWTTAAATYTKPDGSTVSPTGTQLTALFLTDVTFLTAPSGTTPGTATESDYGPLTWTFDRANNTLIAYFNPGDGSVRATVTKLDSHTLVLDREGDSHEFGNLYVKIEQTLTR